MQYFTDFSSSIGTAGDKDTLTEIVYIPNEGFHLNILDLGGKEIFTTMYDETEMRMLVTILNVSLKDFDSQEE